MNVVSEEDLLSFTEKKDGEWLPIPRVSRVIPFGYEITEDNESILVPVPLELDALDLAKEHLKQYSYRVVAQWLTEVTGRYISHMGLKKRVENERRRRRAATVIKKWAKQLEEARSKATALTKARPGAREDYE